MEYEPGGWRVIEGWSADLVVQAQEKHWPTLVSNLQGTGPLGVAHFPWHRTREDRDDHNVMMSFGYVLALAARKRDAVSVLDWGGGVGHYYLYGRALLPEVELEYHGYDLPGFCRLGRTLLPQIQLSDRASDLLGRQYDLVLSSSALHYFEDWRAEAHKLAAATREWLYVARLDVVAQAASFVAVHRINHDGYAEYLSWCINRDEFVSCVEQCGLELQREFVYYGKATVRGAPEMVDCRGFLFRRRSPATTATSGI